MNRSITMLGVAIMLVGFGLIASPIALLGKESFTVEQELGLFVVPISLVVVMIGAVQANPERTTVGGTFGNPEENTRRSPPAGTEEARPPMRFGPRESVQCRHCRTTIEYDVAFCPRCARPRECRACGRSLGRAGNDTDCPGCHRVEAFCNCPRAPRAGPRYAPPPPARRTEDR